MDIRYEYNAANLVTLLENGRGGVVASSYTYDRLGRLVRESDPDWNTIAYEYDALGNRSKMTVTGQNQYENYETVYRYDANNRLLEEVKTGHDATETTNYRYDRSGNQIGREWRKMDSIEKAKDTGRVLFTREGTFGDDVALELREYNGFGQLTRVFRDSVQTLYRYRPDGLRYSKATGDAYGSRSDDAVTVHHWDGQNIVMEASGSSNVKARYLRGVNLIAQQIDGSSFYYLHNAHGDVVQRIDTLGNSAPEYVYDAFGNERDAVKTDPNPFRYCGEYFDLSCGTYYLRNRDYNPVIGRFTQEDVAGDGLNWYTYCGNNPIAYVDPQGLAATKTDEGDIFNKIEQVMRNFHKWWNSNVEPTVEDFNRFWSEVFPDIPSFDDYWGNLFATIAGASLDTGKHIAQNLVKNYFAFQYGNSIVPAPVGGGKGPLIPGLSDVFNQLATALAVIITVWDVGSTFTNPDYTVGQKFLKSAIQVIGTAASYLIGVFGGFVGILVFTAVSTALSSLGGIIAGAAATFVIGLAGNAIIKYLQDWLYDLFGL